jgi:hypothetical protein
MDSFIVLKKRDEFPQRLVWREKKNTKKGKTTYQKRKNESKRHIERKNEHAITKKRKKRNFHRITIKRFVFLVLCRDNLTSNETLCGKVAMF